MYIRYIGRIKVHGQWWYMGNDGGPIYKGLPEKEQRVFDSTKEEVNETRGKWLSKDRFINENERFEEEFEVISVRRAFESEPDIAQRIDRDMHEIMFWLI